MQVRQDHLHVQDNIITKKSKIPHAEHFYDNIYILYNRYYT